MWTASTDFGYTNPKWSPWILQVSLISHTSTAIYLGEIVLNRRTRFLFLLIVMLLRRSQSESKRSLLRYRYGCRSHLIRESFVNSLKHFLFYPTIFRSMVVREGRFRSGFWSLYSQICLCLIPSFNLLAYEFYYLFNFCRSFIVVRIGLSCGLASYFYDTFFLSRSVRKISTSRTS